MRPQLFRELLILELGSRLDRGECPDAADYHERFPDRADAIGEVFALFAPAGSTLLTELVERRSTRIRGIPRGRDPRSEVADRAPTDSTGAIDGLRAAGYEVLGELGRGGMGVVYLARRVLLNRLCAVKMILDGASADAEASIRFLGEAETVARLQHPNIVQLHHFGERARCPSSSWSTWRGEPGSALDGTPWPAAKAAALIAPLARAVAEAHRLGIVHRDLKPANILLTGEGTPKVADFGLAKSLDGDVGPDPSGPVVGTPSYMAPEQAEGETRDVGPATDIYSLGAILYELLTGRPPFKAATVFQTLDQVATPSRCRRVDCSRACPATWRRSALKCLQKDPREALCQCRGAGRGPRSVPPRAAPSCARPAGAAERAWKWARRRPAVALLSLALASTSGAGLRPRLLAMAPSPSSRPRRRPSRIAKHGRRIARPSRMRPSSP